jgi:uncharacterized protein YndB with AHSA1/START domain
MASHDYHFTTHWRAPGSVADVYELLSQPSELPRWWPSVYLAVEELAAGDPDGRGRELRLLTKGWLPYRLRWCFRVTEVDPPSGFALVAWGDFVGEGRWRFQQDGPEVAITYDWRIRAEKPLLRRLSWLLRPLFAANHRWAMAQGQSSLLREIDRRRSLRRREARDAGSSGVS